MPDYSKSVIYEIFCNFNDVKDTFIGATVNLRQKKYLHKKNDDFKDIIEQNGGWDNWSFKILESYPCNSKSELNDRLKYYVDEFQPTINETKKIIEGKGFDVEEKKKAKKEYQKEYHKIYQKEYQAKNKDKRSEIMKNAYAKKKITPWICDLCDCEFLLSQKQNHLLKCGSVLNI